MTLQRASTHELTLNWMEIIVNSVLIPPSVVKRIAVKMPEP